MKLDLYRENPYARVPLVTTNYDDYDETLHEAKHREYDASNPAGSIEVELPTLPTTKRALSQQDGLQRNISLAEEIDNDQTGKNQTDNESSASIHTLTQNELNKTVGEVLKQTSA